MKKVVIMIIGLLVCLGCLSACTRKGQAGSGSQSDVSSPKATYTFQDINGKKYEAPLLENVPKCTYDYDNLTDEKGIKSYMDHSTGLASQAGIDVSKYQGTIDWAQVKASGIDFAVIRLGYRGYGKEGTLSLDENYQTNIEGALAAGLDVGVYFFSQAVTDKEAKEEADFVLKHLKDYEVRGPVVFDTEEIKDEDARTLEVSNESFTDSCIAFCNTVKDAGYSPMIYANLKWMAFTLQMDRLTAYDFWYADYNDTPQCPYDFQMWQYSEEGKVAGIEGNVDMNLWIQDQSVIEEKEKKQEAAKAAAAEAAKKTEEETAAAAKKAEEEAAAAVPQTNGRIVAIDAGHQGQGDSNEEPIGPGASETKPRVSSGTSGAATGINEYELNLTVALQLETELTNRGYQVVMIRTTHDVNMSNSERAAVANEAGADVFIRIHANGSEDSSIQGALTMCMTPDNPFNGNLYDSSRRLSECVLNQFSAATGASQGNIIETDTMSGINWCQVPVTILEMGYMSNPDEDVRLNDPAYQQQMVQGIANGIDEYCSTL
ncbi:MAG: N-acetylmuramoyl-L-alanine amidase [Hespellia sp.]|nr:N-acetylmuramoyl-L-alanine amidase [Hespellia sp.]